MEDPKHFQFGQEKTLEKKLKLDRESGFSSLLTRRFVIAPSFSIYGGNVFLWKR